MTRNETQQAESDGLLESTMEQEYGQADYERDVEELGGIEDLRKAMGEIQHQAMDVLGDTSEFVDFVNSTRSVFQYLDKLQGVVR